MGNAYKLHRCPPLRHALFTRMRDRATLDRLPKLHALRMHADEMEQRFDEMNSGVSGSIKAFVVAWNRARSTWQRYTGETLI